MPTDINHEDRLDEIIAAYLKAVEDGSAPSRQALLDSHPDLAAELADFFADQERVHRMTAPLRAAGPPPFPPPAGGGGWGGGPRFRDFGDYEVIEEIARGGMGVVFKAWQKSLHRCVALKMLLAGPLASPDDLQRFRAEAEAAARLDHPNIVPIHDVGVHDGHPYLSMKLLQGGSLAQAAARPISPRDAARLLASVADAVHYAHQRGVLHRDLKPANILLDDRGQPYVTDFGLAKRMPANRERERPESAPNALSPVVHAPGSPDFFTLTTVQLPPMTHTGAVVGTPAYMAPEQASGGRDGVTVAADVYGLGAVLYALTTGGPPFKAETPLETLRLVRETEPRRPRDLNRAVDRDLETVCLKCLAKDPSRRYTSAAELAADLRRYLAGETILARPTGRIERLARSVRRHPVVSALVTALVLTLTTGLAAALILWQRAETHFEDAENQRGILAGQLEKTRQAEEAALAHKARAEEETKEAEARRQEADAHFRQAHEAVNRLRQLSDELGRAPGTQPLRRQLLQAVLNYYQEFVSQRGADPVLRKEQADAQFSSAQIISSIGSRAEALAAYRRAQDLYRELHEADPDDADLQRFYVNSLNNVGVNETDIAAAQADFREARRLYETFLCTHPDDEGLLNGLANTLSNLGAGCLDSGRFEQSRRYLEESIEIQEGLLKSHPFRIAFTHDLAMTESNLGTLYTRLPGKTDDALRCYDRARDLYEKLARALPKEAVRQADYAASLNQIGILLRDRGDKNDALKILLQADAIRQKVADDNPSVLRYQIDLALSHDNVGVAYGRGGERDKALVYHEKARDLLEKLHQLDPKSATFRKDLAVAWYNISACQGGLGRIKEEHDALSRACDLQASLVKDDPDNYDCRCDLGRTVINLGLSLHRLKRYDEAREVLRAGIASLREGMERSPQAADGLRPLLTGQYINLSLVERSAARPDDAIAVTLERLKSCAPDGDEWYRGALEFAAAAPLYGQGKTAPSPEEQAGRARCADLAMEALRQAVSWSFHDVQRVRKDRELDLVRSREDYRALIDALEKNNKLPETPAASGRPE